jgi:hypothetical protein
MGVRKFETPIIIFRSWLKIVKTRHSKMKKAQFTLVNEHF